MQQIRNKREQGFTIIEVVLVLAIAGLIFLIVFLALPQLQRSRRDTQRKSDAGRVVAALENYASNENGNYPSDSAAQDEFEEDYMSEGYVDPSGVVYDPQWAVVPDELEPGDMYITVGYNCDEAGDERDVAVSIGVEDGDVFCQDNQ